jgi:thiamine-phosphate pyrophosphorylase
LCLITDRRLAPGGDLVARLRRALAALPPGSALVQVREKDLGARALLALVTDVLALGARVLVNDRVDVALAAGPGVGVQLPEDGMAVAEARALLGREAPIGASVHGAEAAAARAADGADLVLLAPIWDTPGPGKAPPLGPGALAAARAALDARGLPAALFALGGIDAARAAEARTAGADGVAAIRAVMAADDPGAGARDLLDSFAGSGGRA